MPTIYKDIEIDVDLDDFETEDLIEEIERRQRKLRAKGKDFDLSQTSLYDEMKNEYLIEVAKKYSLSEIQDALPL